MLAFDATLYWQALSADVSKRAAVCYLNTLKLVGRASPDDVEKLSKLIRQQE